MKTVPYKIITLLIFSIGVLQAQKSKHNFKEEFKVNSDVIIDINSRHSDIEIETWNKDKVVIEAEMIIEGEDVTDEMKKEFYEKWDFDVKGNKERISITSRSNNRINLSHFDFDIPDYSSLANSLSELSIGSLDILDSVDFEMPEMPEMIFELPEFEVPEIFLSFDFDEYKKNKKYLEEWKKKNEKLLGEEAEVKIDGNSVIIKNKESNKTIQFFKDLEGFKAFDFKEFNAEELSERLKEFKEERKDQRRKLVEIQKEALAKAKIKIKEYAKEKKEANKKRKEKIKKYIKERKEIKSILKSKSKFKIKKIIKIKVPKNATFDMDVKYGALKFSK